MELVDMMGAQQSQVETAETKLHQGVDNVKRLTKEGGVLQKTSVQDDVMDVSMLLGNSKRKGRLWSPHFDPTRSDGKVNEEDVKSTSGDNGSKKGGRMKVHFGDFSNGEHSLHGEDARRQQQDHTSHGPHPASLVLSRLLNINIADPFLILEDLKLASEEDLRRRDEELGQVGVNFIHKWCTSADFKIPSLPEDQVEDITSFVETQLKARNQVDPMTQFDAALLPVRIRGAYHEWQENPSKTFSRHTQSLHDPDDIDAIIHDYFSVMHLLNPEVPKSTEVEVNAQANMVIDDVPTEGASQMPPVEIVITDHDEEKPDDIPIPEVTVIDWTTQDDDITLNPAVSKTEIHVSKTEITEGHVNKDAVDVVTTDEVSRSAVITTDELPRSTAIDGLDEIEEGYFTKVHYAASDASTTGSLQESHGTEIDSVVPNCGSMVAKVVMSRDSGDSSVIINPEEFEEHQMTRGIISMQLTDTTDGVHFETQQYAPPADHHYTQTLGRLPINVQRDAVHDLETPRKRSARPKTSAMETYNANPRHGHSRMIEMNTGMRYPMQHPGNGHNFYNTMDTANPWKRSDNFSCNTSLASTESRVDPSLEGKTVSASTFIYDNAVTKLSISSTLPIAVRAPKKNREWETLEKTIVMDFD